MFTHKNDDLIFGAISVMKAESHIGGVFARLYSGQLSCRREGLSSIMQCEHSLNIEYFMESAYVDYVR